MVIEGRKNVGKIPRIPIALSRAGLAFFIQAADQRDPGPQDETGFNKSTSLHIIQYIACA